MSNVTNTALYVCARFVKLQALWSRDHAKTRCLFKYKLAISCGCLWTWSHCENITLDHSGPWNLPPGQLILSADFTVAIRYICICVFKNKRQTDTYQGSRGGRSKRARLNRLSLQYPLLLLEASHSASAPICSSFSGKNYSCVNFLFGGLMLGNVLAIAHN